MGDKKPTPFPKQWMSGVGVLFCFGFCLFFVFLKEKIIKKKNQRNVLIKHKPLINLFQKVF